MDALKLLILASEDHRKSNKSNDCPSPPSLDDDAHKFLRLSGGEDRRDSIMLLAEQASKITPIMNFHRPRASSEPWMTNSSIQALFPHSKMQYQPNMPNLKMGVPMVATASTSKGVTAFSNSSMTSSSSIRPADIASAVVPTASASSIPFSAEDILRQQKKIDPDRTEHSVSDGFFLYQMKENLEPAPSSLSEGRVGIYNKEERKALIRKFHEKQKRRIWNKKVRYFCRKNLADTRVRIKGRFVNPEKYNKILAEQALATGKNSALFYTSSSMDKSVDDVSPSSTEEVFFIEQVRPNNSSSVTSSTTLPTTSKVPTRPAIYHSWPDGTAFVPVESMLAGHPSSGLAPRLFYNSMDSSSSGASGYFGSMDSSSSGPVLYFGSMDSNASGHEGLFNPYGMVHGSLMSDSTDSAAAAAFAAAVAAGMNPMGSYVNFGSSSMDALTNPGVSGSTDSSGSSASSSLGILNMLTLMSSQSMDSLDGAGIDPFASLNISLSSASSDVIHNNSSSGTTGDIAVTVSSSDSVCIANNTAEVSADTNSNNNSNSNYNSSSSNNMKSRKRKSTSPSHAEDNEEVDKTEDASPSSTTSQNDDATAATTATTTTTRIKTSSSSSSRQQRGKQQKDPSSSSSSTSDNVSGGIEGKSRRSIAQLTEQVDQQKQTQPRKKK